MTTTLSAVIAGGAYPQFAYQAFPVTGAPGTGSATPTNAAKGLFGLYQLRVGGCYLFRFDDGSAWEIRWGFYTGTVITRPANGFVASSSGSGLTLTANVVCSVLTPLGLFQRGMGEAAGAFAVGIGQSSPTAVGMIGVSADGTNANVVWADTNLFTRQPQNKYTSATTASSPAGVKTTAVITSVNTGFHFTSRFGSSQIPTAPRLCVGLTNSVAALGGEPSALTDILILGKDSTDTNIQMMVNDASGSATKQDTSIAFAINTLYEAAVWCDPAGATGYGLLIDYTNQALWYGSASSNLPTASTGLSVRSGGGLNGTDTGTALVFHFGGLYFRSGA